MRLSDDGLAPRLRQRCKASVRGASMHGVAGRDRLLLSRCVGLVGAVALAAAAYLGGAFPDGGGRPLGHEGPLCLAAWLIGNGLMVIAWWLAGRSAPSLRWV